MLVTGSHLAKYLGLSPQRITQMQLENKIIFKSKRRKLYDQEKTILAYDQNTEPGHALRHQGEKDGFYR